LIFPISSESGAVLAFGGRSISEAEPKYLNSPDTPIYKKGQHLFGFHLAKSHIREKNQAILVEGYFDMVTLFQHGVRHVVASLGTALTEQQIYLLKRFAENIYFFYDNDEAGVSATLKGIDRMFEQNINPWILKYDGAKDPDQFIREQGKKALVASLDRASDGVRFILNDVAGKYPLHIPEKKRRAIEIVKISLEKFDDPIVRDGYQRLAADFFNIDPGIIKATLGSGGTLQSDKEGLMITPAEKDFIASILAMPEFIAEIRKLFDDEILAVLVSKNIIRAIFRNFDAKSNEIDFQKVAEKLNEAEKIRFNIIFSGLSEVGAEKKDLIEKIESSFLSFQNVLNNRRIKDINRDIRVASRDGNLAEVKRLMTLKDRFVREKRKHFAGGAVETSQG
jgi:DNA primase